MTRRTRSVARTLLATLLVLGGPTACADSTAPAPEPTLQMVAGSYHADERFGALSLTTTEDGRTIDWLDAGGSIQLELRADGTTAGRVFVPGVDEDGGDFDADLAGRWTLANGEVRLSHPADTFLRDMAFTYRSGRLQGDETFDGVRVRVTLARQ